MDVYLTWGEPPAAVAEKIADMRRRAAAHGRTLRFGIRLHVIVRETSGRGLGGRRRAASATSTTAPSPPRRRRSRASTPRGSGACRRCTAAAATSSRSAPTSGPGVGLVRGGAGTALVGDPETVAERMREYAALGIDTFILSGYPHLEEAYRVAELLFPRLPVARRTPSRWRPT